MRLGLELRVKARVRISLQEINVNLCNVPKSDRNCVRSQNETMSEIFLDAAKYMPCSFLIL